MDRRNGYSIDDANQPVFSPNIVLNPNKFYQQFSNRNTTQVAGIGKPIVFVIAMALIGATTIYLQRLLNADQFGSAANQADLLIYYPALALCSSVIGSLILFVFWRLLNSDKNFETVYWCVAYLFISIPITALASSIPYLGGVINALFVCFLLSLESIKVHRISKTVTALVFSLLAIAFIIYGVKNEYAMRHMEENTANFAARFVSNNKNVTSALTSGKLKLKQKLASAV